MSSDYQSLPHGKAIQAVHVPGIKSIVACHGQSRAASENTLLHRLALTLSRPIPWSAAAPPAPGPPASGHGNFTEAAIFSIAGMIGFTSSSRPLVKNITYPCRPRMRMKYSVRTSLPSEKVAK